MEMMPPVFPYATADLTSSLENRGHLCTQDRPIPSAPWSPSCPTSGVDGTETCIQQLSDLTTRIYSVYRTSCGLNIVPRSEHATPPITATVFQAATTLFGQSSSPILRTITRNASDETFTASRTLLESLSRLLNHVEPTHWKPAGWDRAQVPDTMAESAFPVYRAPSVTISGPNSTTFNSQAEPNRNQNQTRSRSGDSPEPVVTTVPLPVIISCFLVYATLVSALQRDAMLHTCTALTSPSSTVLSSLSGLRYSSPLMVELRLFVLMQLIAYFLDRLQETMTRYPEQFHQRM
ncbi:hypothetical protein BBP40_005805 [Aspergillus hancockii]|nr:hypothetical protein BBP40_005805 [Aspergillus hancockii]